MLVTWACFSTSVSGILSCHLIRRILRRQLKWKRLSCRACLLYCTVDGPRLAGIQQNSKYYCTVYLDFGGITEASSVPDVFAESAKLAFAILLLISVSMTTERVRVLPR